MIRYILPIIYLLISLAVEADEISAPPKIMSYNVYMLDHRLGIFVGGTNPNKRAELLANSPVLTILMCSYLTRCLTIKQAQYLLMH